MRLLAPSSRRAYHHGDLQRALLDAALRIIEREGQDALTLREVARQVGVSQSALYHHFADKEALLAAVAEEGFLKLCESMVDARDAAGKSPLMRFRAIGIGYVRFAVRHPAHFRVVFSGRLSVPKYPSLHEAGERAFGVVLAAVAAGQEAGVLREGSPGELAIIAWSTMHGLSMLYTNGVVDKPAGPLRGIDDLAEAAAEAIAKGLAS